MGLNVFEYIKGYADRKLFINNPIYWEFTLEELSYKCDSKPAPIGNNICHVNIIGLSRNHARSIIIGIPINKLKTCRNNYSHNSIENDFIPDK